MGYLPMRRRVRLVKPDERSGDRPQRALGGLVGAAAFFTGGCAYLWAKLWVAGLLFMPASEIGSPAHRGLGFDRAVALALITISTGVHAATTAILGRQRTPETHRQRALTSFLAGAATLPVLVTAMWLSDTLQGSGFTPTWLNVIEIMLPAIVATLATTFLARWVRERLAMRRRNRGAA